jgi:two-component system, NtrC family, sensor kinase
MPIARDRVRRVLVVDDNPAIHDDFRKILEPQSRSSELAQASAAFFGEPTESNDTPRYCLATASQGVDGLSLVAASMRERDPFDVAFVDMRMPPGWDGVETIQRLWDADPGLQVVICTAFSDYSWNDLIDRLGYRDNLLILKKPFDTAEVSQLAAALSEKRRLMLQAAARMERLEQIAAGRTKDLDEAHHESESLLAAIASLLIGIDPDGTIMRWNASAAATFGIAADDALGKTLLELPIAWKDRNKVANFLEPGDRKTPKRIEVGFGDANEAHRIVALTSYCVIKRNQHGGVLLLGREITEQHALELHLHQARKLEAIGQLAAGVAHEINTPMQYIGDNLCYLTTAFEKLHPFIDGCVRLMDPATDDQVRSELTSAMAPQAQQLRWKPLAEQMQEALHDSADGVQHVSRIVRALKEFSHPGSAEKTPVDLNRILETTVTVAKSEWKYVAQLEMDFDSSLDRVWAYPGDLNQVFLNLIVNAAQAIAENSAHRQQEGWIRISTRRCGDCAQIAISDNGGGIPQSVRDRVFDPFFTTKDVGKGTGQGLAIAHSAIVGKHRGRIWFDVDDGVGTTFLVEIPIEEAAQEEATDDSQLAMANS